MIRRLIDYLPPIVKEVQEYQAILNNGEQIEISALWDAIDAVFNDQFVSAATQNGVQRWEVVLGINPKGTESLDARKFRILSRLNEQLPYTLPVLRNMLQTLCGEDGYSVEVENEHYALHVKIALIAKSNFEDVRELLSKVVPANMSITVALKYNIWEIIKAYIWGYLKTKTWQEIKDEGLS